MQFMQKKHWQPLVISRYLSERYKKQREVKAGEFVDGSITLRCQILREHLRIEVLNARHLKPPDPIASNPPSLFFSFLEIDAK